jgi:hypothetical protein
VLPAFPCWVGRQRRVAGVRQELNLGVGSGWGGLAGPLWDGWSWASTRIGKEEGMGSWAGLEELRPKGIRNFEILFPFLWFESYSNHDSNSNEFFSNLELKHTTNQNKRHMHECIKQLYKA